MLHLLLSKTNRSWTQDLLASLRSSSDCQEITYVIERCCERIENGRPDDGVSLQKMYEMAQKIKDGSMPQPYNRQKTPRANGSELLKQDISELLRTLKDLPEIKGRTMSGPCKLRCHKCLVRLGKSFRY